MFDEYGVPDLENEMIARNDEDGEENRGVLDNEMLQWLQQSVLTYLFMGAKEDSFTLIQGFKASNRLLFRPDLIRDFVAEEGYVQVMTADVIRFAVNRATGVTIVTNQCDFTSNTRRYNFERLILMLGNLSSVKKLVLNGDSIAAVEIAIGLLVFLNNVSNFELVFTSATVINEALLLRLEECLRNRVLWVKLWRVASDHPEIIILSMTVAAEMSNYLHDFTFYIGPNAPMNVDWSSDLWNQLAENKNRFPKLVLDYGASERTVRDSYVNAISNNTSANTVYYQRWAFSKEPQYISLAATVFNALIDFNNTITKVRITGRDMNDALAMLLGNYIAMSKSLSSIHIKYEPGYGPMPEEQSKELVKCVSSNFKLKKFFSEFENWRHHDTICLFTTLNISKSNGTH